MSVKNNICEKDYIWNCSTCSCKNGKHLASIMNDSAIMWDEIIESNYEETNLNEKNITCKTENNYILVAFLLITLILIAVSIYCYLIKYQTKQKHSVRFHVTNNQLEKHVIIT